MGEWWSSSAFYSTPNNIGFINLGFVWEQNQECGDFPIFREETMALLPEPITSVRWSDGRRMAFMTPTCCTDGPTCHQVLQFLPAVWDLGPPDQIQDLPLFPDDTSGAATAINDNGQIVGISGICDQAVGRHTAKHAVLWENGTVTDIYPDAPAPWWNTPTAINQRGDVVGFAGDPAFVEGDILHAFLWTRDDGIRQLKPLQRRVTATCG